MGFAVPLAQWFRGPLRERLRAAVTGERLRATGIFDGAVLTQLVDQHQRGVRDHTAVLWALLMFDGFHRQVIGWDAAARRAGACSAPATLHHARLWNARMTDAARLRVPTFTSLYPNAAQPRHGLFVAERLRHLRASGRIDAMVVAPVPWFPSSSPLFGALRDLRARCRRARSTTA